MAAGIRPRSLILAALALTLTLSLVCSTSIRYGHADVPVAATASEIQPLSVGDAAPFFSVETVDGERFDFDPRQLERPVVLSTFRGGWCPYCNMHLSELRHALPEIRAKGVDVYFLSGDRAEVLYSGLSREAQDDIAGLDYTILSDANAQAAIALGIAFKASDRTRRWLADKEKDVERSSIERHGVLPVPAVFAISRGGVITYAHANPNYKARVSPEELVAAATAIAGP